MANGTFHVVNETTEDRYDEVDSLDEALRIARGLVREGRTGEPVSIEHNGRVIRQFVLSKQGVVQEEPVG